MLGDMTRVTAREASRGFSALLDRGEHDGEEYTVMRDGKEVARITPATTHTASGFLARRSGRPPLDDDFAADALSASHLLTTDEGDPWLA